MTTSLKAVATFTAALVATVLTTATTVSAETTKQPVTVKKEVKVKTSTAPNKLFKNRRGYYDRYNDTWVYFVR